MPFFVPPHFHHKSHPSQLTRIQRKVIRAAVKGKTGKTMVLPTRFYRIEVGIWIRVFSRFFFFKLATYILVLLNTQWKSSWYHQIHRLRTRRESLFLNLELLGLGRHFGLKFFKAFGYFRLGYQHPFLYCEFLVHVFHYSTIISTKN